MIWLVVTSRLAGKPASRFAGPLETGEELVSVTDSPAAARPASG